ncbi:MAG: hypothetical protein JSU70_13675 [Phycisphaerales bacterium]|nr:MAG: hypothetical protein JSU70_13675 [Phycisphaerales bacterium]
MKGQKRAKAVAKKKARSKKRERTDRARCGLCGKTGNLTKTECCDQWICDDEDRYVLFSYARNSCYRNHSRYTLCGFHYAEGHSGDWQNCQRCGDSFETEMYVYYGTNEYNFETLREVPDYEPTKCSKCNSVIVLGEGGYSTRGGEYFCERCADFDFSQL